jgi:uncharacterized membrane protein
MTNGKMILLIVDYIMLHFRSTTTTVWSIVLPIIAVIVILLTFGLLVVISKRLEKRRRDQQDELNVSSAYDYDVDLPPELRGDKMSKKHNYTTQI